MLQHVSRFAQPKPNLDSPPPAPSDHVFEFGGISVPIIFPKRRHLCFSSVDTIVIRNVYGRAKNVDDDNVDAFDASMLRRVAIVPHARSYATL